jgi:tRNA(Ile)-lysidine synthetase-like protein
MIKIVKRILPKDRNYHVAVSMGVDSVAALFWMRWKGYEVTPVHFNHNLRAQNGTMQERFLALCDTLGLKGKTDIWLKGFGTEAECREARLDFYSRECRGHTIVTAHHLDDWVESYLLNCFRGHPNKNPFELESRFPDFTIVHPFLPTAKRDFKEFLERNSWSQWIVQDETNSSSSGSRRNWIRHNIIPEMARQKLSIEKYARRRIKRLAEEARPC